MEQTLKKYKLKEIIKMIEEHPELLDTLNIQKLEIINNYYKEEIELCKKKISNLL